MSVVKDSLLVDENGYLRVGVSARLVRDFDNAPVGCGELRDFGMRLWPVCGLARPAQSLVVFLGRGGITEASVWQLNENGKCFAKHAPDAPLMRLLLGWAGCITPSGAVTANAHSGELHPEWLADSLAVYTNQGAQTTTANLQQAAEVPAWLLAFLQRDLASLNTDLPGLLAWLESFPRVAGKASVIREVWQQVCRQFLGRLERSTAFFDELRNQAGYYLLREVTAAFIGCHILRCPFTETYQLSTEARHVTHMGPQGRATGGARVIRYDPAPGLWFHEIRGHGFLAQSDALITGEGLLFQPALEDAWSSWFTPAACARYPALSPNRGQDFPQTEKRAVLVLNASAGPNLGHLLWNDCSGLAGILALSRSLPAADDVRQWHLALSPARDLRFARDDHEAFVRDVLARTAKAGGIGDSMMHAREDALLFFDSDTALSTFIETSNAIVISLKSLVISPDLAASFRAEAALVRLPAHLTRLAVPVMDSVRVFVNVRQHDKSLLNIAECLVAAVEQAGLCEWRPAQLLFVLEGTEESTEKLIELANLLRAHGADAIVATGLGINVLGTVLAHCDVAIAPIGSGAVLPTWIYDLPTFLHADRAHMPQAGFWSQVGGTPDNLEVVDSAHIQDVEDRLYSSYVIAPRVFADCFCRLLERWRLRRASRPSDGG